MPRFSARPASHASSSRASETPKARLAASVPAMDWKTRSTGAPRSMARSAVVTWASTQDWIGAPVRRRSSSSISSRAVIASTLSVAGLMPITASPLPYISPSRTLAAMPRGSSTGWLGCRRVERRPGRPMVLRKRVTTRVLAATAIRSCSRMIFDTAATNSGVRPGASAVRAAASAASDSSQSRKPPTVRWATGAKAAPSWPSTISRVTSSAS